ncbi:MAG TPA: fibronectin type III domain-containing protein [Frankiaceae bacterium]|nr:fibronectin type III domain-containing protein [Frankiaceae bacterium]
MAAARTSGQRVQASGATTETRLRWANPDGTFTDELATRPVRARSGDRWADIDTTLTARDGAVRPVATVGDVSFSDGGRGALATLREGATTVSLGWRGALPTPAVNGATARYADALPGIDLEVTALPSGFEQSFVLKTRTAAKTPLRLPLRTAGVAVARRTGDIAFTDKTGVERAWIGSARMWDSNGREGRVGVAVRGSGKKAELAMTPDPAFLANPATAYPVTVDPVVDVRRLRDAYINSAATTTNYGSNAYLKVGVRGSSTYVSYIEYPMASLAGRDILDVNHALGITDSVTCDPKTTTLYRVTTAWTQTTVTWANHPTTDLTSNGVLGTSTTAGGGPTGSTCAANAWMYFKDARLTAAFQGWADDDSTNHGMSIRASSTDTSAAKDFASGENTSWLPRAYVNWKYYPADAPTGLTATATDRGANLTWTAADGNGTPITGNLITVKKSDGTVVATYYEAGTATSASISGLTNGQGYTFSVQGVSDGGTGAAATTGTITPKAVPYAPSDVAATAGNGAVSVTWAIPDSNGTPITGQTVTVKREDNTVAAIASATASATSATVTGLTNGTTYYATVKATNAAGTGPEGSSGTVTPAGVPGVPTGVAATASYGSANVSWSAPAAHGGSPITSYTVTTSPGGSTQTVTSGTAAMVTGLANGTSYTFTVAATNAVGTSAASTASSAITPNQQGPSAPLNVTATAGASFGTATVSWTVPSNAGASALAGYTVTAHPGNKSVAVAAGTYTATVTGLSGGVSYTFVVTARNGAALGTPSAPSSGITVGSAPNAPTAVSATGSGLSATVSWTAPTANGVTITGYHVYAAPGDRCVDAAATATGATVTGLRPNTAHTFVVRAKQSGSSTCSTMDLDQYDGPASAPSNSVTAGNDTTTEFARFVNTRAMDGAIKVWWENYYTVPGDTYTITVNPGGITRTLPPMAVSGVVAGLVNGTTYTVTLTVASANGTWTSTSQSVTPGETMLSATDNPLNTDRATRTDVSDDGRYVVWTEGGGGETGDYDNDAFIADRSEQAVYEIPRRHIWDERSTMQISGDGRHVAYGTTAGHTSDDFNHEYDVYLLDRQTDSLRLVSADASGVPGNGGSYVADVSPDGRYVLFRSTSTNLVTGDYNGADDLFVKDMDTGTVDRVSRGPGDHLMRNVGARAFISGDGRYIAGQDSVSAFWHDRQNDVTQRVAPLYKTGLIDVAGLTRDGAVVTFGGETDAIKEAGFVLDQIPGDKFNSIYQQRVLGTPGPPTIVSYGSDGEMLRGVRSSGVSPDGELAIMHMVAGSETNLLIRDVPRNKTSVLIPGTTSGNNNQSHPRSEAVMAANNRTVSYLWNNRWFSDGVVLNVEFLRDGDAFGKVWYAGWRQGVNTGSGHYTDSVADLTIASVGHPLTMSRTYNSADPAVGWLGAGWTSSYETRLETVDQSRLIRHADGRREIFRSSDNATFAAPDGTSSTLTLASGVYTLTQRDGSKLKFGATGRLTEIVDREGHRTLLAYASGKLSTVTDEVSGRTLTFTWTGARVTQVKSDPFVGSSNRLESTYSYTGNNLTSVCYNAASNGSRCTTYEYNTAGKMTGRFNAYAQRTLQVNYQGDGRVSGSAEGGVGLTTFAYPKPGVTTITAPLAGQVTTQEHDPAGRLVKETDAYGYPKKITYDSNGWPSTLTDQNGTVTATVYSASGDKLSESVGANTKLGTTGKTAYLTYDSAKNVLTSRDRRSASDTDNAFLTTFTYDTNSNVLTETGPPVPGAPSGWGKSWTYTAGTEAAIDGGTVPAGLLKTATDRRGKVTTYRYASNGDLREVENPGGRIIRNTYDPIGRVLTSTDVSEKFPSGVVTTYLYGMSGQLFGVEHPRTNNYGGFQELNVWTTRDRADRVVKEYQDAQELNGDVDRVVDYTVDAGNRVTSMTDNQTNVATTYEYDAAGNLSAIVDKLNRRTEFTYTLRNERQKVIRKAVTDGQGLNPRDVTLVEYTYDAAGRVRTERDVLGRVRRYDYDTQNRRTKVTLADFVDPDGQRRDLVVSQVAYDNVGNVVERWAGSSLRHETYVVDAMDRITSHEFDPGGSAARSTAYTYDGQGNTLTRAMTAGTRTETTTSTYDDLGFKASETVENGANDLTTWLDHDNRGLLVSVTDPRGAQAGDAAYTTDYEYDERGQLHKKELPPVSTYAFLVYDFETSTQRPTWRYRYNHFGDLRVEQEPRGSTLLHSYDNVGRRTRLDYYSYYRAHDTTTLQPYETWTYDNGDRLTQHRDRLGGLTDYRYDGLDHLVGTDLPTVAAGRPTWAYAPDDAGREASVTDPNGATVQRTFDKLDRVATETQVLRPAGGGTNALATTSFRYDDLGNLTRRIDPAAPAAAVTRFEYDAASQLRKVVDPMGEETTATYDLAGRQTTVTNPLGRRTEAVYDLAGRQTDLNVYDTANVLVRDTHMQYDKAGNLTAKQSPNDFWTWYRYDANNSLKRVQQWLTAPSDTGTARVTGYDHDVAGLLTRSTDGRGFDPVSTGVQEPAKATGQYDVRYRYNIWGLLESVQEPHAWSDLRSTYYDLAGRPVTERHPGGVVVTRTFDALGRVTAEHGESEAGAPSVPTADRTFGYDLGGNLTSAGHPSGALAFAYDDRGDLRTASHPGGNTTVTRDLAGRPTSIVDPAGTHTFTWTLRSELDTETDPLTGGTIDYGYDDAGRPNKVQYGIGGSVRTYAYDALGQVVTDELQAADATATVKHKVVYGRDAEGNVTSQAVTAPGNSAAGTHTYAYDALGRMTAWTKPNASVVTYGWDAADNRTSAGSATYTYDDANRLTSGDGSTYTWSPRGTLESRTTGATTTNYSFDALGRMLGAGSAAFTYDSLDRITNTGFAYTGLSAEPAKTPGATVSRGPDGTVTAISVNNNATFVALNAHGDIATTFTAPGTVGASKVYQPFGAVEGSVGSAGDVGFQSDYRNGTVGLTWMGARWYDETTGTFLSRDTMAKHVGAATLMNRFAYADGNPVTASDPDGRCAMKSTGWGGCSVDAGSYQVSFMVAGYVDASVPFSGPPPPPPPMPDTPSGSSLDAINDPDPEVRTVARMEAYSQGQYSPSGNPLSRWLRNAWDRARPWVELGLSFVPGIGVAMDIKGCLRGDVMSCVSVVPGGRALRKLDQLRDAQKAQNRITDAQRGADATRSAERAREAERLAEGGQDTSRATDGATDARRSADAAQAQHHAPGTADAPRPEPVTPSTAASTVSPATPSSSTVSSSASSPKIHGNSANTPRTTYLYRLEDADGNYLKTGVSINPNRRYTRAYMMDKRMRILQRGPRREMLNLERFIVERDPGPLNRERWAGKMAHDVPEPR